MWGDFQNAGAPLPLLPSPPLERVRYLDTWTLDTLQRLCSNRWEGHPCTCNMQEWNSLSSPLSLSPPPSNFHILRLAKTSSLSFCTTHCCPAGSQNTGRIINHPICTAAAAAASPTLEVILLAMSSLSSPALPQRLPARRAQSSDVGHDHQHGPWTPTNGWQ